TLPWIVIVFGLEQPGPAARPARSRKARRRGNAGSRGRECAMGFRSLPGEAAYQSDPRTRPSLGQMAQNQVVLLTAVDTLRTLPSQRPTRQPPALSAWTL